MLYTSATVVGSTASLPVGRRLASERKRLREKLGSFILLESLSVRPQLAWEIVSISSIATICISRKLRGPFAHIPSNRQFVFIAMILSLVALSGGIIFFYRFARQCHMRLGSFGGAIVSFPTQSILYRNLSPLKKFNRFTALMIIVRYFLK